MRVCLCVTVCEYSRITLSFIYIYLYFLKDAQVTLIVNSS